MLFFHKRQSNTLITLVTLLSAILTVPQSIFLRSAAVANALPIPVPDADDLNFGSGTNAVNNFDFTASSVCFQELAVVPAVGQAISDIVNHCDTGNVVDHS